MHHISRFCHRMKLGGIAPPRSKPPLFSSGFRASPFRMNGSTFERNTCEMKYRISHGIAHSFIFHIRCTISRCSHPVKFDITSHFTCVQIAGTTSAGPIASPPVYPPSTIHERANSQNLLIASTMFLTVVSVLRRIANRSVMSRSFDILRLRGRDEARRLRATARYNGHKFNNSIRDTRKTSNWNNDVQFSMAIPQLHEVLQW